jgi:error-prone DNA polymerase
MTYSELQVTTHFSFLRGASSPEELFRQAALLGLPALGIVDRNSVGGVVRALVAAEQFSNLGIPIRMIAGCRLDLVDGSSVLVWPEDAPRGAASPGCSRSASRAPMRKKARRASASSIGTIAGAAEGHGRRAGARAGRYRRSPGAALDGGCVRRAGPCLPDPASPPGRRDAAARAQPAAQSFGLTPLATGDVLYDTPDRRMLQDVVTAIRERCTIDELGFRRERSADRHLKSPEEMARRFRDYPRRLLPRKRSPSAAPSAARRSTSISRRDHP